MTADVQKSPSARLAAGQVDVWLTSLAQISDDLQTAYQRLLSAQERERWQRFRVDGARLQHLVARALVRTSLSRYADVPEDAWTFEANAYGRPYVLLPAACRDLHFNLSHTDGLVACAVRRNGEVGVDVENIGRAVDYLALAPTVFAPEEVASLARTAPGDRCERFFAYWTLKEAYIKARGMGLSLALDGFWFELGGAAPRVQFTERCPDDAGRWRFRQYAPTPEHRLAVAAAAPPDSALDIRLRWVVPAAPLGQIS